jgi:hypothetical protein
VTSVLPAFNVQSHMAVTVWIEIKDGHLVIRFAERRHHCDRANG